MRGASAADVGGLDISVLAVDDDPTSRELVRLAVGLSGGASYKGVESAAEAFRALERFAFDLIVLDLGLVDRSGPSLLSDIIAAARGGVVTVMTADDRTATIVECMKRGAYDYLVKPISPARVATIVSHVREGLRLKRELRFLRGEDGPSLLPTAFDPITTRSPLMFDLFRGVERVAPSPFAVLISGESGTGKELVARAVHELSGRPGEIVAVNVAGLDDSLFSDTLFGHVKGAYTGAENLRKGLVRSAEGGTLFLDEIGDLGRESQVKLLRFLQDGEFYPLGADRPERSRARLVMATNADLGAAVRQGKFRADLYYRLMYHFLPVPPLRERREDIPLLAERFAREAAESLRRSPPRSLEPFLASLGDWPFPGNVRELMGLVHGAMSAAEGTEPSTEYVREYLSRRMAEGQTPRLACADPVDAFTDADGRFLLLEQVEERHIEEALRRSGGNQSAAAALLGVSQSTLSRRGKRQSMQNA